jgi:hypothetical protein
MFCPDGSEAPFRGEKGSCWEGGCDTPNDNQWEQQTMSFVSLGLVPDSSASMRVNARRQTLMNSLEAFLLHAILSISIIQFPSVARPIPEGRCQTKSGTLDGNAAEVKHSN